MTRHICDCGQWYSDLAGLEACQRGNHGQPAVSDDSVVIDGWRLVLTCGACPEQYDVFDGEGNRVGYLRLRHGTFTAEYPDSGGRLVYQANPWGDGTFEDDERELHLRAAVRALKEAHGLPVVRVPPSAMLRERIRLVAAEWTLNGGARDRLASQIEGIVDEAVREAILVTGKVFK